MQVENAGPAASAAAAGSQGGDIRGPLFGLFGRVVDGGSSTIEIA